MPRPCAAPAQARRGAATGSSGRSAALRQAAQRRRAVTVDLGFWAAALTAAVLVGLSKGGMPVVSMLAVPMMALTMNPLMAAGLLLPVYVASDMFGLWVYRRHFDGRLLAILIPAGASSASASAGPPPAWCRNGW